MIGETLRLIRVYHDKKLVDLAKDLDISPSFLSEVEREKRKVSLDLIEKYAQAFDLNVSSIMFFNEELDKVDQSNRTKDFFRKTVLKFFQLVEKASDV